MKFEITSRNYEVGERLEQIAEQKLSKLDKYFGDAEPIAKVAFKKQANSCTTEVMLEYCGRLVRATADGENFYDNFDIILPKLEGQIRKYRTKFDKHSKNSAYRDAVLFGNAQKDKQADIVKQKKFKLSPMTVEEAMEELELLGHNFYVFLEAKSNTIQVLYLRNDGDFGLIEPQI